MSFKIQEATQSLLSEDKEARESIRSNLGTQTDFLTHVLSTIRVTLDEYGPNIPTDTACSAVALFLFCKIVRTGRAIRELIMAGYGVEADLLLRATLEALINLRFIVSQNCEERAQLYIEFEYVLAHQYLQRVDRWQDLFAGLDLIPRRLEIEKQYQGVKQTIQIKTSGLLN